MGIFVDRLNQVLRAGAEPMGFRTGANAQPRPKMLLVAAVSKADGAADCVAGADAGLARVAELGGEGFMNVLQAASDITWGGWMKGASDEEMNRVPGSCDFVVFPEDSTALAMFQGDEKGKVLAVEPSLSDTLMRAADALPVDAVLIGYEQPEAVLTWHHLLQVQRCVDLLAKPLLVSVPANAGAPELQALLAAGVSGVVVEVGSGEPPGRVKELRRVIDSLVLPRQRRRRRLGALVPSIGSRAAEVAEETEEEEED